MTTTIKENHCQYTTSLNGKYLSEQFYFYPKNEIKVEFPPNADLKGTPLKNQFNLFALTESIAKSSICLIAASFQLIKSLVKLVFTAIIILTIGFTDNTLRRITNLKNDFLMIPRLAHFGLSNTSDHSLSDIFKGCFQVVLDIDEKEINKDP